MDLCNSHAKYISCIVPSLDNPVRKVLVLVGFGYLALAFVATKAVVHSGQDYRCFSRMNDEGGIIQTTHFPFLGQMESITRQAIENQSTYEKNPSTKTQLQLYDVLIPSLGGVIILTNLAVVISSGLILKKGQQPRSTYLFLGNVAMSDLITGFAVVFGQLYPKSSRDHYICALQIGMIVSATLTSVYSVGLIAIDRFLYIIHGIQYQRWVYPTRVRWLIAGSWIVGCLVGFMPMFGWYGDTDNGRVCWFIFLAPKGLILLTVAVGMIPLIVVVVLYCIILYHALKKIVQLREATHNSGADLDSGSKRLRIFRGGRTGAHISEASAGEINISKSSGFPSSSRGGIFTRIFNKRPSTTVKAPSKWKAIKVVLFTTSSFVIAWFPYFIVSLYYVYQCGIPDYTKRCRSLQVVIASPLAILGFTNSLINPIIYAWWHKGFREYVHKRVSIVIMKTIRRNNSVDHWRNGDARNGHANGMVKTISSKSLETMSTSDSKYVINSADGKPDSHSSEYK